MREKLVNSRESMPPGWSAPEIMTPATPDVSRAETAGMEILNGQQKIFSWRDPNFYHELEDGTKIEEMVKETVETTTGSKTKRVRRSIGDGLQPFSSSCNHESSKGRDGTREGLSLLNFYSGGVDVKSFYPRQDFIESVPEGHLAETTIEVRGYCDEATRPDVEIDTRIDFFYNYRPDGTLEEIRTIRKDCQYNHHPKEGQERTVGQVAAQITRYDQEGTVSKSIVRQETDPPEIFGRGRPNPHQYEKAVETFFTEPEQTWNEITNPDDGINIDPLAVTTRIRGRVAGTDTTRMEDIVGLIGFPDLPTDPAADSTPTAEGFEPTIQMPAEEDASDDARVRRQISKLESEPQRTPEEKLAERVDRLINNKSAIGNMPPGTHDALKELKKVYDDTDDARVRRQISKLESEPQRTPEEKLAELDEAYYAYVQARIAPTMAQIELVKAQANNTATEAHRKAVQTALEAEPPALERLNDAMLFAIPTAETQAVISDELTAKTWQSIERAKNYLDEQLNRAS